jgi:hypothetical protein
MEMIPRKQSSAAKKEPAPTKKAASRLHKAKQAPMKKLASTMKQAPTKLYPLKTAPTKILPPPLSDWSADFRARAAETEALCEKIFPPPDPEELKKAMDRDNKVNWSGPPDGYKMPAGMSMGMGMNYETERTKPKTCCKAGMNCPRCPRDDADDDDDAYDGLMPVGWHW